MYRPDFIGVVGYASVWGLAWLQEHTLGRPVTLIIGDTKEHRFEKGTVSDREEALELIDRCDVEVLGWYRSPRSTCGESMLHAKAWVVVNRSRTRAGAALVGSANLTKMGIQGNWGMMTVVVETDLPRIWAQLDGFVQGKTERSPGLLNNSERRSLRGQIAADDGWGRPPTRVKHHQAVYTV